ncbi:hypothetical protein OKW45_006785 [Paraburkholderia sp. WSM4175]|uniref:hypothetical protein n=1 Tax=Paraburkholderia sp. WSM4175 TaxID=2991072 RepID=UPI003D201448
MSQNRYEILKNLHDTDGKLAYMLEVFGDTLAQREGYKELNGMDAIHFYLVHKMKWIPSQARAMSASDLRFVLTEEMSGWTAPPEAR